ncbi:DUF1761 domain-containing protein [Candidatus Woesearchaeota archaeon]|nr:DUF1761 domain-containing protein [Candidatus Woesearchaeota archaeon]
MPVNLVSVAAAAAAAYVVGFLYYSKALFAKKWVKLSGISEKMMKKDPKVGMGKMIVLGALSTLVMAYVLALAMDVMKLTSLQAGLTAGFFAWLGFQATLTLGSVLYERKPFALYVLNNGHNLIALLVMGAVLALV